ncbi:HTTM domain-containing protein [Pedobacter sp. HMWF019]|uniref:HTTM domain-containing protein n=1 Tax=Pedobacter sp. HMWF019 TaxID=2056856 RepID=UPI000D392FA8|nr:HTTM domain-containing protein [Pedobacter sp. HMWF019]PTT02521.1 HTTM domain-containing protein [Pedobacter sp. HMWF019]
MMVIKHLWKPVHIAPLVVLRIAFGFIMLVSTIRFVLRGWVDAFYIRPAFHFTFYGFGWVRPFGATGMYVLFGVMAFAALLVMLGLFYRIAMLVFFLSFTYVELLDKTTYLNHYYFVSVMAFLMLLVPAHRYFSLDVLRKPSLKVTKIPRWMIDIFKLQLVLVYFYAGVSKLNYDWLIAAMPLKIWLPASSHLFLIGGLLTQTWIAYVFSWFGMLFDLLIGFFLLDKRTRKPAYVMVVVFHLVTGWFFKIGMFPYIMIFVTLVFFPEWSVFQKEEERLYKVTGPGIKFIYAILVIHFTVQLLLPFRFLFYPGKLYWTEEGYRFSWRVMLMEKGGTAFFHVTDPATGRTTEINNSQYLTNFQETMMATQPDMILQYAHFLASEYQKKGIKDPVVTVQSYVTLNGSGSRSYIDPKVNLAKEEENFKPKKWILPFDPSSK